MRIALILLAGISLASCGARTQLEPAANASLPPAAYGTQGLSEAERLLEPSALAAPERSVELRRRSEERADDPFDLPPE